MTTRLAPRTAPARTTNYWGGPYDGLRVSWPNDDTIKLADQIGTPPLRAWAIYRRGLNWLGTPAYLFDDWELDA